eukprot:tig00000889_g5309.t1
MLPLLLQLQLEEAPAAATGTMYVRVQFVVRCASTGYGDGLVLVGETEELGQWRPERGLRLEPAPFPTWRGDFAMPVPASCDDYTVRFKAVIVRSGGRVEWEAFAGNRELRVCLDPDAACACEPPAAARFSVPLVFGLSPGASFGSSSSASSEAGAGPSRWGPSPPASPSSSGSDCGSPSPSASPRRIDCTGLEPEPEPEPSRRPPPPGLGSAVAAGFLGLGLAPRHAEAYAGAPLAAPAPRPATIHLGALGRCGLVALPPAAAPSLALAGCRAGPAPQAYTYRRPMPRRSRSMNLPRIAEEGPLEADRLASSKALRPLLAPPPPPPPHDPCLVLSF